MYHSLAVSDCYDLEDGDESLFEEAMAAINRDFDSVLGKLTVALGKPTFAGTDTDKKFPSWAATGYRVAHWNNGKRIQYLVQSLQCGADQPMNPKHKLHRRRETNRSCPMTLRSVLPSEATGAKRTRPSAKNGQSSAPVSLSNAWATANQGGSE